MNLYRFTSRDGERGQALVVMVAALIAMIAMVAVIVDGGNAWAQQRDTQNGTDAAAEAGAIVIVQNFGGAATPACGDWDCAVAAGVAAAAANNGISVPTAYYTDVQGDMLTPLGAVTASEGSAAQVGAGVFPPGASGVRAKGTKSFKTFVAGIVGQTDWTANTEATAVAGTLEGTCAAIDGCGILPVTFPVTVSDCDNTGALQIGDDPYGFQPLNQAIQDRDSGALSRLSIVPLCKNGPGDVGWLDFGCGNLATQILPPGCNASFDIPTWIKATTGNPNAVQNEMATWIGQVVLLPLFDGTCKDVPSSSLLQDCTDPGVGNNTYYHMPAFVPMLLYEVHIQGNNHPECNLPPGGPPAGGNGSNGCLKGWFIDDYITSGRVGAFDPNAVPQPLGIQLLK